MSESQLPSQETKLEEDAQEIRDERPLIWINLTPILKSIWDLIVPSKEK